MLRSIHLTGVGPAPEMEIAFAPRLNFLAGDNGLGKSFLLDTAWWALTRTWARDMKLVPRPDARDARIAYKYSKTTPGDYEKESVFRRENFLWSSAPPGRPPVPGIVIYAGVDGSFSSWDPARNYWKDKEDEGPERPRAFHFSPDQVWKGAFGPGGTRYCNGLIHDWVSWQKGAEAPFADLERVLEVLSPSPGEPLSPGQPAYIDPVDETEHPTVRMPYGYDVPLIHASAGMRRIAALAYLLVWTWNGHRRASRQLGTTPAREVIFLIDEVECHLHPQWQRRIVPALLRVMDALTSGSGIPIQVIAATHSPLVLASIEPDFDEEQDAIFNIVLNHGKVAVEQQAWAKQGDVSNWLVSEIFGLQQARSVEAERAIEAAEAMMRGDFGALPPDLTTHQEIDTELRRVLAGHDAFWPRWVVWVERAATEPEHLRR